MFGSITFYNNTATQLAGGLGLTYSSQIYLAQGANILFELNCAGFEGGAIYVEDPSLCLNLCFFQVENISDPQVNPTFVNNHADIAGNYIYGGEIDRCTINNQLFISIYNYL